MTAEPEPTSPVTCDEEIELTFRLATDLVAALEVAAFQRRSLGEHEFRLTELLHEALSQWLEREADCTTAITIRLGSKGHD